VELENSPVADEIGAVDEVVALKGAMTTVELLVLGVMGAVELVDAERARILEAACSATTITIAWVFPVGCWGC
jgi:hypothetical protein